jgi:hypothetical protein
MSVKALFAFSLLVTAADSDFGHPYPCNLLNEEQLAEFGYVDANASAVGASFKNACLAIGSEPKGVACELKKKNGDSYSPLIVSALLSGDEKSKLVELFSIATRNAQSSSDTENVLLPIKNGVCLSGAALNVRITYCVGIRSGRALIFYLPPKFFTREARPEIRALKNFDLIAGKL